MQGDEPCQLNSIFDRVPARTSRTRNVGLFSSSLPMLPSWNCRSS